MSAGQARLRARRDRVHRRSEAEERERAINPPGLEVEVEFGPVLATPRERRLSRVAAINGNAAAVRLAAAEQVEGQPADQEPAPATDLPEADQGVAGGIPEDATPGKPPPARPGLATATTRAGPGITLAPGRAALADERLPGPRASAPSLSARASVVASGPRPRGQPPKPAEPQGLDAWKSSVAAATAVIPPAKLDQGAAAPAKVRQAAADTRAKNAGARKDPRTELYGELPPQPQPAPPEKQLDTADADAAVKLASGAAAAARLADQTFRAMVPLPDELAKQVPSPPPVAPDPLPMIGPPTPFGPLNASPNMLALAPVLDSLTAGPATPGSSGPIALTEPPLAKLDPFPPAQATQIGDVVARVIAHAPDFAAKIVAGAGQQLDPSGTVASLKKLAEGMIAGEQAALEQELRGIATAAGVAADALDKKVAAARLEAQRQAEADKAKLETESQAGKEGLRSDAEEQQRKVSGEAAAVKSEAERKTAAVKGQADPTLINERRDDYLAQIGLVSGAADARLQTSLSKRGSELDRLAQEQKAEYTRIAGAAAARIRAAASDPTEGKIAAQPLLDWADRQGLEVDGAVARLKREAGEDEKRQEALVDGAAVTAREQTRDWAARRLGTERSWWSTLLDLFTDWRDQATARAAAWERQSNAETRDKLADDFKMLASVHDELVAGNKEQLTAELGRMSDEQQLVAVEYLKSGGDSIGAVAAGLAARIAQERTPVIEKQLEQAAIDQLDWPELNQIGVEQTPGFNAAEQAMEVRGAVEGWGTDEKRLFRALSGRTPIQLAAMRKAYKHFHDRDMDEDIDDDLSGSELERANALRSGDPTEAAVATLRDAMAGWGTDEDLIFETLRGKTPAERDAIIARYKEKYGRTLQYDLEDEMSGNDLAQANALLAGETSKADAIAINDKFGFFRNDTDGIDAVYAQIRGEVEADAERKGMNSRQVEAEIKRRSGQVSQKYGEVYGGGEGKLESDYRHELSGGKLELALADQAVDPTAADAARIQIEHEGLWTSAPRVNDVLENQYMRAAREMRLDLMADKHVNEMDPRARRAAMDAIDAEVDKGAPARAKQNMDALSTTYDAKNPYSTLNDVIENELPPNARDEAKERVEAGGKLSDARELMYAISGSNDKKLDDVMKGGRKGRSKQQMQDLAADYKAQTGNDLKDDLEEELSGADKADMVALLETGNQTAKEKAAYTRRRQAWELDLGIGGGRGLGGALLDEEEVKVIKTTGAEMTAAEAEYDKVMADPDSTQEQKDAAEAKLEMYAGLGAKSVDRRREEMDKITKHIEMAVAVAAAVVITVATAGAGGGAGAALVAGAEGAAEAGTALTVEAGGEAALLATEGAEVGTAATTVGEGATAAGTELGSAGSQGVWTAARVGAIKMTAGMGVMNMALNRMIRGGSYGGEEFGLDLAKLPVDVLLAAVTAGQGDKLMKAIGARIPFVGSLLRASESNWLGRGLVHAVTGGFDAGLMGAGSGVYGAAIDKETWNSSDPFAVFLRAGGQGFSQGFLQGGAMAGMLGPVGEVVGNLRGPAVRGRPAAPKAEPTVGAAVRAEPTGGTAVRVEPTGGTGVRVEPPVGAAVGEPPEVGRSSVGPSDERIPGRRAPGGSGRRVPGSGDEPTQRTPRPEFDEEPTQKIPRPEFDEEPTQKIPRPELDEEPTQELQRPEVVTSLPEGSIFYGPRMEPEIAEEMYQNSIRDESTREVMILENTKTGQRVVVQGDPGGVEMDRKVETELAGEKLGGRWRAIKHFHPVAEGKRVTPVELRFPSGRGGDFDGVRAEADYTGKAATEEIDIVTERGRETIRYGVDPDATEPYWVDLPAEHGRLQRSFATLDEYYKFYEEQTGYKLRDNPPRTRAQPAADASPRRRSAQGEGPGKPAGTGETEAAAPATPGEPEAAKLPPEEVARRLAAAQRQKNDARQTLDVATRSVERATATMTEEPGRLKAYAKQAAAGRPEFDWLESADFGKAADRQRLREAIRRVRQAELGSPDKPRSSFGEADGYLRRLDEAESALSLYEPARAAAEARLKAANATLEALRPYRQLAGVGLSPKLDDPLDPEYWPEEITTATTFQERMIHVFGFQSEVRLANRIVDVLGEWVAKYAEGGHGADEVSVAKDGSVTLWDSKYRTGTRAVSGSDTFEDDLLTSALAEAYVKIEASSIPEPIKKLALANLNAGNFKTVTSTTNDVGVSFHTSKVVVHQAWSASPTTTVKGWP